MLPEVVRQPLQDHVRHVDEQHAAGLVVLGRRWWRFVQVSLNTG